MLKLIRRFITILTVTICIPIFLWGSGLVMFTAAVYYMDEPSTDTKVDGAIVLTGGTKRVEKGLDLLAEQKITNLLVSGVHKDVEIRDIMSLWGKKEKVPPCCITLGREAGNTIGNAQEAKKWIDHSKLEKVYLITANYHMPRALLEFNHEIPNVKIIPFPVKPENFNLKDGTFWRIDLLEYHKLLVTIFRIVVFPKETEAYPEVLRKEKPST